LSKKLNEKSQTHEAYCIGNNLRPLLSYGPKGARGGRRTYLYVEAIRTFADVIHELDLSDPQRRASEIFSGRLEHTFGVLREEGDQAPNPLTGANAEGVGVKRPFEAGPGQSGKRRA